MGATREVTVQFLRNQIGKTVEQLMPILGMANAPMVTYFTHQLWKTYVPTEIQQEIQTTTDIKSAVDIYWQHLNEDFNHCESNSKFKHFRAFLSNAKQYHLDNMEDMWITPDQLRKIFDNQRTNPLPIKGFMNTKKNHEVNE